MVGARRKCSSRAPALAQHHTLSSRRCAHRRTVDGSGKRDGILAVRRCLLGSIAGGDPLTGLLSAVQGCKCADGASQSGKIVKVFRHGRQIPRRTQMRFALIVVALAESPSVADDRVVAADGTSPRQQVQWDHPGSMLSFASGSAIKRITAGVKARR